MTTSGWESQEHLERVITVSDKSANSTIRTIRTVDNSPTYMSHWKPVNVPSITIRTGRPFHRPENPILP